MEDSNIVSLYWDRSEEAIAQTDTKYGAYLYGIAWHILEDRQDSEESVSDTYLAAWNGIPPKKPNVLSAFLGKITRRISIDRWRRNTAAKRGGGQMELVLEELSECVSDGESLEERFEQKELVRAVRRFVSALPERQRNIFVCRYFYLDSVGEIAERFGCSENTVSTVLHRTRKKLQKQLRGEGL